MLLVSYMKLSRVNILVSHEGLNMGNLFGRAIHEGSDFLLRMSHFMFSQKPREILANLSTGKPCRMAASAPFVSMLTTKIPKKVLVMYTN